MRASLILRLAGVALLVAWVAQVFSVTTAEFTTNERRPMTAWQKMVKVTRIVLYDQGRFLHPDAPSNTVTIVVPRDSQGNEFVDVTPPERAGVFLFFAITAAGLILMAVGWVVGLLPRVLMLSILGIVGVLAGMYYLNQRPLIPLYMK